MNTLGIDYGDKQIGLAIADNTLAIAMPLKSFKEKTMRQDIDYVAAICSEQIISKIVIGLPLNMDGSEGERASKTRSFGNALSNASGIEVCYKDERLSTAEAKRGFSAFESFDSQNAKSKPNTKNNNFNNKQKAKNSGELDTASAQIILQSYLDSFRL